LYSTETKKENFYLFERHCVSDWAKINQEWEIGYKFSRMVSNTSFAINKIRLFSILLRRLHLPAKVRSLFSSAIRKCRRNFVFYVFKPRFSRARGFVSVKIARNLYARMSTIRSFRSKSPRYRRRKKSRVRFFSKIRR